MFWPTLANGFGRNINLNRAKLSLKRWTTKRGHSNLAAWFAALKVTRTPPN